MHNAETFRLHLLFIGLNIDMRKGLAQALVLALQLKKHSLTKPATTEKTQLNKTGQASPWVRRLGRSGGEPWLHAHFRETERRRERNIVGYCKLFYMVQNLSKDELNMINQACIPRKHVQTACAIVSSHISSTTQHFNSTEPHKVVPMIQFHFFECI